MRVQRGWPADDSCRLEEILAGQTPACVSKVFSFRKSIFPADFRQADAARLAGSQTTRRHQRWGNTVMKLTRESSCSPPSALTGKNNQVAFLDFSRGLPIRPCSLASTSAAAGSMCCCVNRTRKFPVFSRQRDAFAVWLDGFCAAALRGAKAAPLSSRYTCLHDTGKRPLEAFRRSPRRRGRSVQLCLRLYPG